VIVHLCGHKEVSLSKRIIIIISLFFKALSTYSKIFLCYIDIWFLTDTLGLWPLRINLNIEIN
jgi:hypothetical protein